MEESIEYRLAAPVLTDTEFAQFSKFIYQQAGIDLSPAKRALVQSRLSKRIRQLQLGSYSAYWRLLHEPGGEAERQRVVNLLSTNETYFFREPQHFDWLRHHVLSLIARGQTPVKIWSAACSTGEEPYTIAMVLAEAMGLQGAWQVYASDINTRVTAFAKRAVYPLNRVGKTPKHYWEKYFLRGQDEYEGMVRVVPELVRKVSFSNQNLLQCQSFLQNNFDVVFLRNVLIYFDEDTKQQVIGNLCGKIRTGGYLLIGHSESMRSLELPLVQEVPSRYRLDPLNAARRK